LETISNLERLLKVPFLVYINGLKELATREDHSMGLILGLSLISKVKWTYLWNMLHHGGIASMQREAKKHGPNPWYCQNESLSLT
jgi:hypothetical protein